jgi:hypothetical protein
VIERNIGLREQLLYYILDQYSMNIISNLETFDEVDTVQRIRAADQIINVHVFGQQETFVNSIQFSEQNVR